MIFQHLCIFSLTKVYYVDISLENSWGWSAHFYIVNFRTASRIDILELLIEASGADLLTKQDNYGYNILHLAAYFCSYDLAEYLIDDIGMDKKVKTYKDETAQDVLKDSPYKCKTHKEEWRAFRTLLNPKSRGQIIINVNPYTHALWIMY